MKSVALLAGLAAAAVPAAANAQDEQGHRGWQHGGGEGRGNGGGGGGWRGGDGGGERGNWRGQQAQPAPQAQVQQQVQAQPQVQVQQAQRMDRGDTPGRGWGSDRDRGQRYGRDWSNGGMVNRPDAAWRNRAAEQAQQAQQAQQQMQRQDGYRPEGAWRGSTAQQQVQRSYGGRAYDGQRTYSDAWRNRSYQPRAYQQGWDGDRNGRRWDGSRTGGWDRDWRRDNRFAWQSYRNQHRDVFRMGRYYSPYHNWSYRRLGIGFMLQPLFFSQNYWIDDPWMYRLPEAYGPYRWIRYYDDALLVNIYDGEVVDVIYDFFW
ncbi:MAG TPA: RcnB family protein [Novosphingobium sp.]|nr:RcnB family protein [Novosphingobium sp.]